MLQGIRDSLNAVDLYKQILDQEKDVSSDLRMRAAFNLSQLIRGSGFATGKSMQLNGMTKAQREATKTHDITFAHRVVMQNIIIE